MESCAGSHASASRNGAPGPREELHQVQATQEIVGNGTCQQFLFLHQKLKELILWSIWEDGVAFMLLCCQCFCYNPQWNLRLVLFPPPPNIFQAEIWQMSAQPGRLMSSEMWVQLL